MTSTPISNPVKGGGTVPNGDREHYVKGMAIFIWRSTYTWTLSSRRDAGITSAGGLSHSKGTNMADRLFKTALILAIVCVVVVVCVVFLVNA